MDPQTQSPTINQPTPQIPQSPTIPPQPNSKLSLIIGALVLIILIGTGTFYLGKQSGNNENKTAQTISPTKEVSSPTTPTVTTDETINWKIYDDKSLKYSFEYPGSWVIDVEELSAQTTWDSALNILYPKDSNQPTDLIGLVYVYKESIPGVGQIPGRKVTLEEFLKEPPPGGYKEVIVNGNKMYQGEGVSGNMYLINVFFEKDKRVFQLSFTIPSDQNQEENKKIVEKIINSIRFQ